MRQSQKIGNIMNPVNSNHVLVSEAIDNVIDVFDKIKINMVVIKGINDEK